MSPVRATVAPLLVLLAACLPACWTMTQTTVLSPPQTQQFRHTRTESLSVEVARQPGGIAVRVATVRDCLAVTERTQAATLQLRVRPSLATHIAAGLFGIGTLVNTINIPMSRPDQRAEIAVTSGVLCGVIAALYVPSLLQWTSQDLPVAPVVQTQVANLPRCQVIASSAVRVSWLGPGGVVSATTDAAGKAELPGVVWPEGAPLPILYVNDLAVE